MNRRIEEMKSLISAIAVSSLVFAAGMARSGAPPKSARAAIDAGNQAWIDGVKTGNIPLISATYADDAVDCGPTGECTKGRLLIEQHMTTQLASLGRARSASVKTWGTSQHGNFAYEWGQAEATFNGGTNLVEKYLTVWQLQADGGWKIFRNMVIPEK
jgi:ketosteroid isomerase-like protein